MSEVEIQWRVHGQFLDEYNEKWRFIFAIKTPSSPDGLYELYDRYIDPVGLFNGLESAKAHAEKLEEANRIRSEPTRFGENESNGSCAAPY